MDPFEEFEFKPLTDGLGFHKKKIDLDKETKTSGLIGDAFGKTLPQSADQLLGKGTTRNHQTVSTREADSTFNLNTPLPRKGEKTVPKSVQNADVIDQVVKSFRQPKIEFNEKAQLTKDLDKRSQNRTAWSVFPFIVDGMMIVALSLMGLIVTLSTTQVDFVRNLTHKNTDPMFFVALASILVGMGVIYLVITRGFMGSSFGEIVFDVQTGNDIERQHPLYPIRVIGRAGINVITGVIFLPLISMLFRRDFAGQMTGTALVRKD